MILILISISYKPAFIFYSKHLEFSVGIYSVLQGLLFVETAESHQRNFWNITDCKTILEKSGIGLLQLTITWYKIRRAGGQAHYYSPTGTLKQRQVKLDWFRSLCFNVPVGE